MKIKTLFLAFTLISLMVKAQVGYINTIAGTGTAGYSGDSGEALSAKLNAPFGIAINAAGDIYFADNMNNVIRKITASTGVITTIAGIYYPNTGTNWYYGGDGGAADSAYMANPFGVALDTAGNIYFADNLNNVIRKITVSTGIITTVAGDINFLMPIYPFVGDGGAATSAALDSPWGVALDHAGNIYIADQGFNVIRKVTASTGIITTVVGDGTAAYTGDNGLASNAELNAPDGVTIDAAGNMYISDDGNNVIRKVSASTGIITTIAGNGTAGYTGDNGTATSASINDPSLGVAIDAAGNIYICDDANNVIRKVTASTGKITTIAGTGALGYSGDNGPATSATLNGPEGIALDTAGNIYIADGNNVIRKVTESIGSAPSTPVAILGSTSVCNGSANTYSVAPVSGATSYTWTLPGGWSGISTTDSIIATAGTSGNISVTANNSLGSSPPQTLSVTVNTVNTSVTQLGLTLTAGANGAGYVWINCNGNVPVTGETSQSFTATNAGNYAVIVTQNGCSDTSACFTVNTGCSTLISGADLPYSGLSILLAVDSVTTVSLGTPGLSQTWDYSSLIYQYQKFADYQSTSTTPYASVFPASNVYTYGPGNLYGSLYGGAPVGPGNGYVFWRSDNTGFWVTGFRPETGLCAGINIQNTPQELLIGVPASYGSVFNNSGRWELPLDKNHADIDTFYVRTVNKQIIADACGSLTTPYGLYPNVLREHEHVIEVDSVYIKMGTILVTSIEYKRDTSNNYMYISNSLGYPACTVHADKYNNIKDVEYYAGLFAGINNKPVPGTQFSVYPNPSDGKITIEIPKGNNKDDNQIFIYNSLGSLVWQKNTTDTKISIDITCFSKGIYYVKIVNSANVNTEKIVIQ